MKKFVLIAIAAIAFTTASQAQDSSMAKKDKKMHEMKAHRGDMMSELNLTADQQEKMKKLREDNRTKMEAIRSNASLSDEQKQEQMKSLHTDLRKSTEALLTDDQKTKWKELRKEHMENRKGAKAGSDSTMQR